MTGLGETLATLAALRPSRDASEGDGARLIEVAAFGGNPGALRMRIYTPEGLPQDAPLVVVLHGCTQTAQGYAAGAGWLSLADAWGFAVLCPEQTRANNPNLCFNWFEPTDIARGSGEAASIGAMIAHALRAYSLDPKRVFITGLSAGAAMANVMLATYPEVFAGGALIAGLPYGSASNVQEALAVKRHARSLSPVGLGDAVRSASGWNGPWPSVSVWQGVDDATVKPAVAEDLARQWVEVHGLETAKGETAAPSTRRRQVVWRKPSGEVAVELHRISGMGHGAPLGCTLEGGCGQAGPFLLEVGVSSTLEIARSWGLLEGVRRAPSPDISYKGVKASPAVRFDRAPEPRAADIGAMISDALRGAGLIR